MNNEYGVKSGKFPDAVLGAGQWSCEKGKPNVKEGGGLRVLTQDSSKQAALIEKAYGKGKVYMRVNSVPEEALYDIINANAPRRFFGKDNRFHLAMRQGTAKGEEDCLYLSVLNPDVSKTLEDEIVLLGEHREIADVSCNFPIVPEIKDGKTIFKLRLAPLRGS